MNKLNSIYVSILALVVAIAALVMCIMCYNNKQSVSVEQALLDNPEMIVNAMQKYEENMREQALAGAQKLIDANIEDVNNDANTPFVGAADAEKVVVEFYDYSCGYCHRLFPELKAVMANNGDVKFAFKPLTFVSPISEYAARAALAANKQGKFIEMHNAMFEFGGQLTEAVRRHPYSVVLFDEVEKAHPDVFNVLLQVLDDGRITDSQGRTVDFKNTILIMTSNLGSEYILNGIANDDITPEARAQVDALLKTHFRPEFLNRIDEIVYYKPLTKEQISKIVLLMLGSLNKRLADRQLKVELTDAAMNAVIDQGFDPVYGARPLKRFIQSKIETLVAKHIIAADVKPGDTLTIDVNENGELYMRW